MSRAPPSSMVPQQYEPQLMNNIPVSSTFQSSPHAPSSILQRAIQQSEQQFHTNPPVHPMSNGFNNVAPFQPFDIIAPNSYPSYPAGPIPNQVPLQSQQQSPIQTNNIRLVSPQIASSPLKTSHTSPPTQAQTPPQQTNSPRMSGGSTLQFVPSQVLRNMPKNNK